MREPQANLHNLHESFFLDFGPVINYAFQSNAWNDQGQSLLNSQEKD